MSPDSPQPERMGPQKQIPERHRSKKLFVFLIALVLLLLSVSAFSIYITYTVQHQQVVSLATQLSKAQVLNAVSQASTPHIHFVESIGYPFIAQGVMPPVVDIKLG